jgi:ABC-type multidrug transport system fused ATPase/permease subunit/aminoglycoside phosphotransferase (APT) family kinase protein
MSTAVAPGTEKKAGHDRPREYANAWALIRHYIGNRRIVRAAVILLVVEAIFATIEPFPIAYLIDYFHHSHHALHKLGLPDIHMTRLHMMLLVTGAIVVIAAINSAADSGAEIYLARAGRVLGYNLRNAMYTHLQRLSLSYHDRRRTGDVLTRVTGDVLVIEEFVIESFSDLVGSFLVLVLAFVVIALRSWKIALVALVIVPMLGATSAHFSKKIKAASKLQRVREGELASTAQEMLSAIRLVQSYGRGKVDHDRFAEQSDQSMHAAMRAALSQAAFSFSITLVEASAIIAIVWMGVWLLDRNVITVGILVLFILMVQNMFKPSRRIVSEWNMVGKTMASVDRIRDLLDRVPTVTDAPDAVPAPTFTGRLAFDRVSFAYHADGDGADGAGPAEAERRVLHDISFEAEPGAVVAIVGPSGAGKSTIAQLVPRLYDPDEGAVRIDGTDIRDYTLESLRRQVSLVLQDTVLFSGTVADNIGYGVADATTEQIVAAARLANAHDFISELPEGYDTLLGERGVNLSGGQRQRISIARAFIRESPLLILDEPTTGLDAHASHLVIDALATLMRGKTTILISHDLGLVRRAEVVHVIEDGRIVQSGSHEDLLRAGGVYADLSTRRSGLDGSLGGSTVPLTAAAVRPGAGTAPGRPQPPRTWNGSASYCGLASAAAPSLPQKSVRVPAALAERLPGLAAALDGPWARAAVGRLLLGRDDPAAVTCRLGPVWLREDGGCDVRYTAVIEDDAGCRTATVSARVPPNGAGGRPVTAQASGWVPRAGAGDWAVRTGLAAWDRETGVVLHAFPHDPGLPTLPAALDPTAIWPVLGRDLPAPGAGPSVSWCEVSVAHYPREGPCVLLYHLPPGPDEAVPRPLAYGKVYPDDRGALVSQVLTALGDGLPSGPGPGQVRLPRPLAYLPELRLVLTEAIAGTAALPSLLTGLMQPESSRSDAPPARVADVISAAGAAAAALHAVCPGPGLPLPLNSLSVRTLADELTSLRAELAVVRPIWPDAAARVDMAVTELSEQASRPAGRPPVLSHGDFTPRQLLIDLDGPGELGLVDFDAACRSEPALDLGRFLAYLHVTAVRRAGPGARPVLGHLTATLLNSYDRAARATEGPGSGIDGEVQRQVAAFRAAHLARLALRACRRLKDDRARIALDLLDARDAGMEWT